MSSVERGVVVSAPAQAWEDADEDAGGLLDEWTAEIGAHVDANESIASMMVAKTSYSVDAPVAGTLVERLVPAGATITRGQALAVIDPDEGRA